MEAAVRTLQGIDEISSTITEGQSQTTIQLDIGTPIDRAVNDVRDAEGDGTHFSVNVIPHTQAQTTLGELEAGQAVNIEIDVLARYLQRMESYRAKPS